MLSSLASICISLLATVASTKPPTIVDLAFLAGSWRAELGPMIVEEIWLEPRAGNMTGVFRMTGSDGVELLEIMSAAEGDAGVVLHLRHFNEALVPWASEADGPLVASAVVPEPGVAVFTPTDGDAGFQSITYRREGDTMTATVVFAERSGQDPFRLTFERSG
ncbi:MAG: DUF6265 family protein [Phycisphaerales bacterium]